MLGFGVAAQGLIDDLTMPSGLPRGRMRRVGNPKDVLAVVVTIIAEVYRRNAHRRYGDYGTMWGKKGPLHTEEMKRR